MVQDTSTRPGLLSSGRRRFAAVLAAAGLALAGLGVISVAQAVATNPFLIDGTVPDDNPSPEPDPFEFDDPEGNAQELGPVNSNLTKLGVIHSAVPPMLSTTNPNAQVDLRRVWLDTKKDGDDNAWLYFAWERDSNRGSGVIMYEFQQDPLPDGCDYSESAPYTDLIAGCNPWENRQPGDFIIVWDQAGNTINIILRTWSAGTDTNGNGEFDKGEPLVLNAGGSLTNNGNAFAALSPDNFRGEAAVNLTATIFAGVQSCTTIGNVIPGTVTGNSDTADYKDTVLAPIADYLTISNCGSVTVTKVTDPAGGEGNFVYALSRSGDQDIRYAEDGYEDDELTSATGTLTADGDSETVVNLIAAANYTLAETFGADTPYDLTSIVCTLGEDDYLVYSTDPEADLVDFPVVEGETTDCVITNTQERGTLIVKKVLTNDNGGALTSRSDFSYTVTGDYQVGEAAGQAFATSDDGTSFSVIAGTYSVAENGVPITGYTTSYANTYNAAADCANLVVAPNATVTCTVTNNDQPASPTGATTMSWTLHDSITISGIRPGGSPAASVTFRLYSDATCTTQVGTDQTDTSIVSGGATTTTGYLVTTPGTYYWRAQYSGDSFNNGFTTACGSEVTQVTATYNQ